MRIITVENGMNRIPIGRIGENEATEVVFNVSGWETLFDSGNFALIHQRLGDPAPYPCAIERVNNEIHWQIKSSDLSRSGNGKCELVYTVGEVVAKSAIFTTVVGDALTGGTTPPAPWEDWVNSVLEAGEAAQEAKEQWEDMQAEAETLPAGTPATASYSGGVLRLGIPAGTPGGVTEHKDLSGREESDQHPMSAISGLQDALASKQTTLISSGASVGQIVQIAAVDASGKPTAWQAVNMPSGGGSALVPIAELTLTEAVATVRIDKDSNGNSFTLKRIKVFIFIPNTAQSTSFNIYLQSGTYPNTAISPNANSVTTIVVDAEYNGNMTIERYKYGYELDLKKSLPTAATGNDGTFPNNITMFRTANWTGGTWPVGTTFKVMGVRA